MPNFEWLGKAHILLLETWVYDSYYIGYRYYIDISHDDTAACMHELYNKHPLAFTVDLNARLKFQHCFHGNIQISC